MKKLRMIVSESLKWIAALSLLVAVQACNLNGESDPEPNNPPTNQPPQFEDDEG